MNPSVTHLAALSFIVAPAMLTNACAIMGLSSSNRLAIASFLSADTNKNMRFALIANAIVKFSNVAFTK